MNMKQKMQYIQTLKQTLKLNQKLLKSLDFLTDNIDDINKVVQQVLETNPFLELKSPKNYDTQQFIESISNKRSLKDDLYFTKTRVSFECLTIVSPSNFRVIPTVIDIQDQLSVGSLIGAASNGGIR